MKTATLALAVAAALAVPVSATPSAGAARLSVVAWASKVGEEGLPPANAVRRGVLCSPRPFQRLYAFVRFSGMRDKVPSSAKWFYEGEAVYTFPFRWEDGPVGRTAFHLFRTKGALLEGVYRVEIRVGGRLLARAAVRLKFGAC